MNGFELAREVNRFNSDVKIVLMTAFEINKLEFSKVMPSTRVDDFVRKPAPIKLLITVILKHIGNSKILLKKEK